MPCQFKRLMPLGGSDYLVADVPDTRLELNLTN